MKVGLLCSRLRVEEKQLLAALASRSVTAEVIDEDRLRFDLVDGQRNGFDLVLERCADPGRAAYAVLLLENMGLRCLNTYGVTEIGSNKVLLTMALARAGVPQPRTSIAFEATEALAAAEAIGFPVVFKPAVGAWEHLLGKVNDRQAAEAILEHKAVLGTYHHTVFYIQEFIKKPGRDIRLYLAGDQIMAAVYRRSQHWSTGVLNDVVVSPCPLTPALEELARRAAAAVGGGLLAVDLVEDLERGPLVVDVGHTGEFRQAAKATGIDIAAAIVAYALEVAGEPAALAQRP